MALPKGFDTPFRLVSARESPSVVEGLDCLDRSIKTIIRTHIGERVYRPTFGSLAKSTIFANMTDANAVQLGTDIREAIATWEPRVSVDNILFELDDNTIRLQIAWRPLGSNAQSLTTQEFQV